jgi:hypothetical protein
VKIPSAGALRAKVNSVFAGSSLSDHGSYRTACITAASDDRTFANFRGSAGAYRDILEHVSSDLAQEYAMDLQRRAPLSPADKILLSSDLVGNPDFINVDGLGPVPASALRYLSVARKVQQVLRPGQECHVVEIGVGYGGLVRILAALMPRARFTLVDLPETLALARRYLAESGVTAAVEYVTSNRMRSISSDLLISNYALSELRRPVQNRYIAAYVSNAKSGYVTWNSISPRTYRSLTPQEFARAVRGRISPEDPESYPGNKVITWHEGTSLCLPDEGH